MDLTDHKIPRTSEHGVPNLRFRTKQLLTRAYKNDEPTELTELETGMLRMLTSEVAEHGYGEINNTGGTYALYLTPEGRARGEALGGEVR